MLLCLWLCEKSLCSFSHHRNRISKNALKICKETWQIQTTDTMIFIFQIYNVCIIHSRGVVWRFEALSRNLTGAWQALDHTLYQPKGLIGIFSSLIVFTFTTSPHFDTSSAWWLPHPPPCWPPCHAPRPPPSPWPSPPPHLTIWSS